jgi:hypothetical protein
MRNRLLTIDRWVDRIVYWAGGYVLLSGAMTWAASYLEILKPYGRAETLFFGIGAASVLALVSAAFLAAWRYFRPLPEMAASRADVLEQVEHLRKRLALPGHFVRV